MYEQNEKTNMRIKNKLLGDPNSNLNDLQNTFYKKYASQDSFLKQNNSFFSQEGTKKFVSALSDLDIFQSQNNSSNNGVQKIPKIDFNKKEINPMDIYEEIKSNIENLISNYNNETILLNLILKEILNATIIIINDFVDNKKIDDLNIIDNKLLSELKSDSNGQNDQSNNNSELDINSKIVFLLKIQKLNNKIKKCQEELEFFRSIINANRKPKYGKDLVEFFKKKMLEMKEKNQEKEYEYLFCIEELKAKINALEEEIQKKEKDNLPIDTIKLMRCFPNSHHYDLKENINPKSIPLYQQFHKDKIVEKFLKKDFKSTNNLMNSTKNKKILLNNNSTSNRTKLILSNPDSDKSRANLKYISFGQQKDMEKDKDKDKEKDLNSYNVLNYNRSINRYNFYIHDKDTFFNHSPIRKRKPKLNIDVKNDNKSNINLNEPNGHNRIIEMLNYHPKTILDNNKEYFLSHPTLNIAGVVKKKESKYVGLPKKLLRLKVHKNLEKNMQITFPSSLNETLVNLEKLKKFRNIVVIENDKKSINN